MTEEQKKKYRLLDNKTSEFAEWDIDKLTEELEGLDFDGFDFGFDLDEPLEANTEPDEDIDDIEGIDTEKEPMSHIGQIYKLGKHRLMCGDSTNAEMVDKLINGIKVDMVFTDPPYGMNLDTDYQSMQGFGNGNTYEQGKVDEFHPEMVDAALSIDAAEVFLWGADYFAELIPDKNDGSWIVWDKRANGNDDIEQDYSSDKMYGSCFELCWIKNKHKRDIARVKWCGIFGLNGEFDAKRHHPTQKPIALAKWFIDRYSHDKDVIVDLFGGSGTTLLAAEMSNRQCSMMEYDPHYVDVIISRWEKYTGLKAELIEGE